MDGIPPTERLNLSKICGTKHAELITKMEKDIVVRYWRRKKDYVFEEGRILKSVAKLGDIKDIIPITFSGDFDYCTINEDLYLFYNLESEQRVDVYKVNEDVKNITQVGSIKPESYFDTIAVIGAYRNNIYINAYQRGKSNIYKYDVKKNNYLKFITLENETIGDLYLIDDLFYTNISSYLYKIEYNKITKVSTDRISGYLRSINNNLYSFRNFGSQTSTGSYSFEIHKFNKNTNKLDYLGDTELKTNGQVVLTPFPDTDIFAFLGYKSIHYFLKELYLTEKREE